MPIPLGSRKQVFIDWTLIDAGYGLTLKEGRAASHHLPHGVRLTTHAPVLMPEPTFPADQPWEDLIINSGYSTLLQEEGRLRLYYETFARRDRRSDLSARVCLAESEDGRRWRRDPLGIVEYEGSRQNNIVYSKEIPGVIAAHGANVFRDPSAPPEERYKIVHVGPIRGDDRKAYPGLWASVSPDGLHWRPLDKPLMQHETDTQNVVQYDAEAGVYRAFVRGICPAHALLRKGVHGRRCVDAAVTKDFRAWPNAQTVLAPDAGDPPDLDIYTNGYTKWPGADAHLMFPAFYSRGSDLMQVHLAVSRDGWHWSRPQRAPLLPAGEPGTIGQGGFYAGQGIAALTDTGLAGDHDSATLWAIPIGPIFYTHNYAPEADLKTHLRQGPWLATIRPDGFMSLSAETAGECWTYPLTWSGNRLLVNAWARFGGSVRFGFETKEGPVDGYRVEDCDPLEGDCLWKAVTWRGKGDVSALAGQDVCLHIRLLRSRLHALRFAHAGA